jgi:hypothetical protein
MGRRFLALALTQAIISLTGCGSTSAQAAKAAGQLVQTTSSNPECSKPLFPENPKWYVGSIANDYGVFLTKGQAASIAQLYSCPLSKSEAEGVRGQIANLYTYNPNDANAVLIDGIVNALQDTYGQYAISLSDSQLNSLVGQYLEDCVPMTSDGYTPDFEACMATIRPEISGAAQQAAGG